ncbi:MAG TPA: HAMP domain-containing protein, partial [Rugosimonospora sp.]|nr:HAMP domain-containing protein [Rugosimonospora sp.]
MRRVAELLPWRRWTLRARMVVAIAALAAVALIVSGALGVAALRSYLVGQVDDQLYAARNFADLRESGQPAQGAQAVRPDFAPRNGTYRFAADGSLLRKENPDSPDLGGPAQIKADAARGRPFTVHAPSGNWRVIVVERNDGTGYFATAVSLQGIDATVRKLLITDVAVSAGVLILLGAAAASVVRLGLHPLTRMEVAAAEIADGDLSRRVEDADPHTESGRLGLALNAMLARIEDEVAARDASEARLRR